jgi:hypothetical protein
MIRFTLASNGELVYVSIDKIVCIRDSPQGCVVYLSPDWYLCVEQSFDEVVSNLTEA